MRDKETCFVDRWFSRCSREFCAGFMRESWRTITMR